jgi:hypothetical protein
MIFQCNFYILTKYSINVPTVGRYIGEVVVWNKSPV